MNPIKHMNIFFLINLYNNKSINRIEYLNIRSIQMLIIVYDFLSNIYVELDSNIYRFL